jgi:hypothetical protein
LRKKKKKELLNQDMNETDPHEGRQLQALRNGRGFPAQELALGVCRSFGKGQTTYHLSEAAEGAAALGDL